MFKSSSSKILISLPTLLLVAANFDFRVHFCRFKCGDAPKLEAYYWRDFYGAIPTDAYPLGHDNQNPQTYIGLVYDPSKKGTFTTTIVYGLNYVYSVYNGKVTKKTSPIQILCTQVPEKLIWMKLTQKTIKTLDNDDKVIKATMDSVNGYNYHYIAKTSNSMVTYAGSVTGFDKPMEYALLDGTSETTETFMLLIYRNATGKRDKKVGKNIRRPFFSHRYEYSIQPNSIIPKFYEQINIGPCSVICTNKDMDKEKKLKSNNNTLLASMAYYWKPNAVFDLKDLIRGDDGRRAEPLYIGQSFPGTLNSYDVGESDGIRAYVYERKKRYAESGYFHVLSSNHQDKFEWVNTSSENFSTLDKSRMIPGGLRKNDKVFVGRTAVNKQQSLKPGSIRKSENGTYYIRAFFGEAEYFQVLMFKNPKEKS